MMGRGDKVLYLQCDSGVSGDMLVGALLDLGADENHMRAALQEVGRLGARAVVSRRQVRGLDVCDFDVRLPAGSANRDHDMAWLYGDGQGGDASGEQGGGALGAADGRREHVHGAVGDSRHTHRTLAQVMEVVDRSALGPRGHEVASRAFELLAQA